MAVLKNKTQGNYTIVSQNIMRDRNLSLTERGMLLTLLSLPDNWNLTIKGLCQILPDGKDRVSKTLNSLIEKGYITREQNRDGGGKFDSTNLEVHETPISSPSPSPDGPGRKVIKEFPTLHGLNFITEGNPLFDGFRLQFHQAKSKFFFSNRA